MEFQAEGKRHVAHILDGRQLANTLKLEVGKTVQNLEPKPGLAALLIGDDPASTLYVNLKKKACEAAEISFNRYDFTADASEEEIIEAITFLNKDPDINGILVQLPLPKGFNTDKIISRLTR